MKRSIKKGFTLIELLVVISIIALLAAIMMPVLNKAMASGRAAVCINNMHNIGLTLASYASENKTFYPPCYNYLDGGNSCNGYCNWTAMVDISKYSASDLTQDANFAIGDPNGKSSNGAGMAYPRSSDNLVCPSHAALGFAPTDFTANRIPNPPLGQTTNYNFDDEQAPRLSYVVNEVIMPRKKCSPTYDKANMSGANTSNLCLVRSDEPVNSNRTILAAEFSNNPNAIYGQSSLGGAAFKSHRPTNGLWSSQANGVFDGEAYTQADPKANNAVTVNMLSLGSALNAISTAAADDSKAANCDHISYINPVMHESGSNYVFLDGHTAKLSLAETVDPNDFKWGDKVYSCIDKPVITYNATSN